MKLLSVNVSATRAIACHGKTVMTGIYKEPFPGKVKIQMRGLAGDAQADLENHGGIYKAVYSYPAEHYDFWSRELDRNDFGLGQFGENLTLSGIPEDEVHIGDTFRIGEVLLEMTQPRVPCFKLAIKMNLPGFPKQFMASGRYGFYQRVLAEGEVTAGDAMERMKTDPRGVTVREMMRVRYVDREDFEVMEQAMGIPALTPSWRDELKERLRDRI